MLIELDEGYRFGLGLFETRIIICKVLIDFFHNLKRRINICINSSRII